MKKKIGVLLFYFLVATILCLIVFGVDRKIVMIDAKNQYIPFMNDLFQVLSGQHSFLYTWNLGLGDNFIPIFAYYLASPITMFFAFIAQGDFLNVVNWMVVFRMALACFTMYLFLDSRYRNRFSWILALGYGLGSFAIGFADNYMWMDSLILLPLLAIAIDTYMEEKKGYWISLIIALALFSNYYSAAFMVLSASFYYLYQYCIKIKLNFKQMCLDLLRYAFYIALGLGLAMILLYPALMAMEYVTNKTLNAGRFFDFFKFNTAALYLPYNLFSGSLSEVYNKASRIAPLLYCGSAVILLNVFYFFKARLNVKLSLLLIYVIMISPYCVIAIDYMFNLFYNPVWFSYRYSYMLIFFMIFIANLAITQIKDHKKTLFYILGAYTFILLATHGLSLLGVNPLGMIHGEKGQVMLVLLVNLGLIGALGFFIYKNQRWLLALIMIFDLGFNGASLIYYCYKEPFHPIRERYFTLNFPQLPKQDGCINTFYQTAPFNIGMYDNVQSNAGFASTLNSNMINSAILLNAGTTRYNKVYFGGRYALDVLFGNNCVVASDFNDVKYVYNHPNYQLIYEEEANRIYQSRQVYNLGFVANSQISQSEFEKLPLSYKDLIMINQVVLEQESILKTDSSYQSIVQTLQAPFINSVNINTGVKSHKVPVEDDGYYYMNTNLPVRAHMKIGDQFINYNANIFELTDISPYYNAQSHNEQYMGYLQKGDDATYEFFAYGEGVAQFLNTNVEGMGTYIRAEDMDALITPHLDDISNVARDKEKISATVHTDEEGVVVLQIPYDSGWRVSVNQEAVKPIKVNGGLLGFVVKPGTHEIKLQYTNPNIQIGAIISFVSLGILIGVIYKEERKKKHLC